MADGDRLEELLAKATANLGIEATEASKVRLQAKLRDIAAELALEWITGERRFESQGQQTEAWLARLYEDIYADEQPQAPRIYARFGLPLPRAQYLVRLLLARRTAQWREAARKEVLDCLAGVEAKSEAAIKKDQGATQRWELSLTRGGFEQLMIAYDFMAPETVGQTRPSPPRRLPSSPALTWFTIAADTTVALLAFLRKPAP